MGRVWATGISLPEFAGPPQKRYAVDDEQPGCRQDAQRTGCSWRDALTESTNGHNHRGAAVIKHSMDGITNNPVANPDEPRR
jgi:hypothetical protein